MAVIWFLLLMPSDNTRSRTCDELGEPHKWVTRKVGENEYLVCEKCKILPGGHKEEGDGHSS